MGARREDQVPARRPSDCGQGTVELAMVLPLVALLLLVVVQVGIVVRAQVLVVHAAREAARAAAVAESDGARGGAARHGAQSSGAFGDDVEVETAELDGGRSVRATVRHTEHTDVPLVGALLPDVTLESSAVMRIEQPHGG